MNFMNVNQQVYVFAFFHEKKGKKGKIDAREKWIKFSIFICVMRFFVFLYFQISFIALLVAITQYKHKYASTLFVA